MSRLKTRVLIVNESNWCDELDSVYDLLGVELDGHDFQDKDNLRERTLECLDDIAHPLVTISVGVLVASV